MHRRKGNLMYLQNGDLNSSTRKEGIKCIYKRRPNASTKQGDSIHVKKGINASTKRYQPKSARAVRAGRPGSKSFAICQYSECQSTSLCQDSSCRQVKMNFIGAYRRGSPVVRASA